MSDINIQIVKMEPMRIASAYGYGQNPEEQAWKKLSAWAEAKGFLNDNSVHPVFGFNNPNPTNVNPLYGYEFWMKVGPDIIPEGEIRIIEFMGGTYAVARCEGGEDPGKNIPAAWQNLARWCKENNHRFAHHQPLEKIISGADNPEQLVLELYCPIVD